MTTILDELSYAKELLSGSPKMFVSGVDIRILAKYFYYLNFSQDEIYLNIINYYKEKEFGFNEFIHQDRILKIIKSAEKSKLRFHADVPITENEIKKIKEIKNYKTEKLIFTMLVLAKYFVLTNPKRDLDIINDASENKKNYYLTMRKGKILSFAKINKKKNENLFYDLYKIGIIYHYNSRKSDRFVLYFDRYDDSNIKTVVTNMNKIYDFYKPYCEVCGIEIEKRNNRHSMCSDCWKEREKEIKRISWRKNNKKLDV